MDNKRFGIGVIGCGGIAGAHIQAFLELKDQCEILALSDLDRTKAEGLASEFGLSAAGYENYHDMLAREDIDIVAICTPPFVREVPIVDALAAGKHVLSEKPFAASLEECDRMLEAARRHDRKLGVMLQTRFDLSVRKIRHIVESGALGPILFASAANHHWRGDTYYDVHWRGNWEKERGGVLMNLGIHTLDVFLWIMGELESVQAEAGALGHAIETEDVVSAVLRFRNGAIGQFATSTTFPVSGSFMDISGKSSMVRYPLAYAAVKPNPGGFFPVADDEGAAELERLGEEVQPGVDGFAGPVQDLFDAIRENRDTLTGGQHVRTTVEAITAIYKAASTGQKVRLPIAADDPWYTTEGIHRSVKKHK